MSARDNPKKDKPDTDTSKTDVTDVEPVKDEDVQKETPVSRDAPQKSPAVAVEEEPIVQTHDIYEFSKNENNMVMFTTHCAYRSQIYHPGWRVCLEHPDSEFTGRSMRWVNRKEEQKPNPHKKGSWKSAMYEVGG